MRRFLPLILVLAALLLDISVVPILVSHWAVPSLSLCTVCVLGLLLGRTRGSLYGLIGGVLMDVLVGYPLGLKAVLYILSGYLCGVAGRKFQRYLLTVPVEPALCFILYECTMIVYLFMAGRQFSGGDMLRTLGRIAIETLLCQFFYLWFNRMLRPKWSRYAAR